MANNKGCTPAASTACTACRPGISCWIALPVNSCISLPKTGIFLRRAAHHRKGPYRMVAGIHFVHLHQRKGMLQTIITQMIAKWPLGFIGAGLHFTSNHKIGIGADAVAVCIVTIPEPVCRPTHPANVISLIPSGRGITAAKLWLGGPPTKQLTFNGWPFLLALVWCTPMLAVQLVVQSYFLCSVHIRCP